MQTFVLPHPRYAGLCLHVVVQNALVHIWQQVPDRQLLLPGLLVRLLLLASVGISARGSNRQAGSLGLCDLLLLLRRGLEEAESWLDLGGLNRAVLVKDCAFVDRWQRWDLQSGTE